MHILPELKALENKYSVEEGLVVVNTINQMKKKTFQGLDFVHIVYLKYNILF